MPECRGGFQKDPWGVQAHQNVGLGNHGHGLLAPRRRADAVFSHLAGQAMKWALKGMMASRWEGQLHLREQVEQDWIAQVSQVCTSDR